MSERSGKTDDASGVLGDFGRRARAISDKLPGSSFVRQQVEQVENMALSRLQSKLDSLNAETRPQPGSSSEAKPTVPSGTRRARRTLSLSDRFEQMVDASMNQTPDGALEAYFGKLLDELVPDEVRLLNATAGGTQIPIVHIDVASRLGGSGSRIMGYLSRAGNEAGVMCNELTPQYLSHLANMGLLEEIAEEKSALNKYEMIENSSEVRKAMESITRQKSGKARAHRASLALSKLGQDFMACCTKGSA